MMTCMATLIVVRMLVSMIKVDIVFGVTRIEMLLLKAITWPDAIRALPFIILAVTGSIFLTSDENAEIPICALLQDRGKWVT